MPRATYASRAYLTGRSLAVLSRTYSWTPVLRATTTDPNLGEDGEAAGAFAINGVMVTAWARFRWGGADADGGSGRAWIVPPIAADPDAVVLSGTGCYGSAVGVGQNRNADDSPQNMILIGQFNPNDDGGFNLQRTGNNAQGITGPQFFDSDGDALSMMMSYVADADALNEFLGLGGGG